MEPYGLGVIIVMGNLEATQDSVDPLQPLHLPEEPTGNKLVVEMFIQQQSNQ
jgi:hypothetical protein